MDINSILKLIDAGYTKDEIAAMQNTNIPATVPENHSEEQPEPVPDHTATAADPAAAEPENPNITTNTELSVFMDSMKTAIADLTKAIQLNNISAATRPAQPAQSAEDILYNMLNGGDDKK